MQKFEKNLLKIQLCVKSPLTDADLDIPHKELDFFKSTRANPVSALLR